MTDTGLAAERTALAWRRTGLTHLVTGLFAARLVDGLVAEVAIATLFGLSAVVSMWNGAVPTRLPVHHRGRIAAVAALSVAGALLAAAELLAASAP